MDARTRPARTGASNLWVTFRVDGTLRLELLADWYTLLGTTESHVDDADDIARTLATWALRPEAAPVPRFGSGRETRSRDLDVGLLTASPRDRAALGGGRGDEAAFRELFGETPPGSAEQVETRCLRLARRLGTAFRRYRSLAGERLADGAYLPVLRTYLARCRGMGEDPRGYRLLEHSLLPILEDERYLRLADDEQARALVAEIDDEVSQLYGRCMDLER